VKKKDFYVDVVAVLVQKILEKIGDAFEGDVAANHNVPATETTRL